MVLSIIFHIARLLCFAVVVKLTIPMEQKSLTGSFWHISDLHFDRNYSKTGNPQDLCHEASGNKAVDNGYFGNFLCDSPENLVKLTIKDMKLLAPNPDFIIWTGDNLPHTRNPPPDWDTVFTTIAYITNLLNETFYPVKIFPTIGNHDTSPANLLEPSIKSESIYDDYLEKGAWNEILPKSTWDTFKRGGFYSYSIQKKLRIISLNTMLWYYSNTLVQNFTDPLGQLQWFEEELVNASLSGDKVYIIGHVAPGFYNRVEPGSLSTPTYHIQYLSRYLKIVKEHPSVILGQMFGHVHNDMFQLQYCDTGEAQGSLLIGSSVTPWHTTHSKFNESLAVNPSIRLMLYDKRKYTLLDYQQYFLNLTFANNQKNMEGPLYESLYNFTSTYEVRNLSTNSLVSVYEKLKKSAKLFNVFFKYLTSAKVTVPCDRACKSAQLCSMSCTSVMEYGECMHTTENLHTTENPYKTEKPITDTEHSTHVIAMAICIPGIIIIIVISFLYYKTKPWSKQRHTYNNFSNF